MSVEYKWDCSPSGKSQKDMANATVVANPNRIYNETLAYMVLSYEKGPQKLIDICLAVGYGPRAVREALERMDRLVVVDYYMKKCRWWFAYSVWEYRRRHYWRGQSYEWYIENPMEEMPTFKRMRFTCDVLGCVIGWFFYRHRRQLTVPEALAVLRDMNWTRHFEKYSYGNLPSPAPAAPPLRIDDFSCRIIKRMGDLWCTDSRKMAKCVQLQKCHAFGAAAAYEYMKKIDEDYEKMERLREYFSFKKMY